MTDWAMQNTEHDLSEMLGAYLRRRTASAKEVARLAGCDPRTAEGFRAGRHWPQAKHWRKLATAFGREITDFVFHPEEWADEAEREVAELEAKLAEKRALAREAKRSRPQAARSFAPLEAKNRPAEGLNAPGQDHEL